MQEKTVWFGTEDDLVQVKCPSTELTRTRVSWRNSGTYLNGGGFAISSGTGHDEAAISWGADSVEGFSTLLTQLNKGEPLYYLDPLVCKTNILPPYAAQFQPNNPFGFVAESATGANGYPSTAMKSLYTDRQIATVPVPEGYRLWVGCAGSSGGVYVDAPPPEWVEVGRNLLGTPNVSESTTNWRPLPLISWGLAPESGGLRLSNNEAVSGGNSIVYRIHGSDSASPGQVFSAYAKVKNTGSNEISMRIALFASNGSSNIWNAQSADYIIPPGGTEDLKVEGATMPEGTTNVRVFLTVPPTASLPANSEFVLMDNVTLTEGVNEHGLFSGDHAPEGMRSEWLGEPNNSVSVLYKQKGNPSDPEIPATPPNSGKRVTHSYPGGGAYHLFVRGGSVLQGVMAQILPEGQTPASGGFIPGMGFSALALQDNPQITEYSAVLENYQMAMTANFIEVGSWM